MIKTIFLIVSSYLVYGILGFLFSLALFSSLHPEFYLYTFALLAKKESLTALNLLLALLYLVCFLVFVIVFPLLWGILGGKRTTQMALVRYFFQTQLLNTIIDRLCFFNLPEKGENYLQRVEEKFSQVFRQILWDDGEPKGWLGKIFADFLENNLRTVFLKELRESWQSGNQEDLQQNIKDSLIKIFQPSWDYLFLLLGAELIIYFTLFFIYKV